MMKSNMKGLTVSLSVAVLIGILVKLAIDNHFFEQDTGINQNTVVEVENTKEILENNERNGAAVAQQKSKLTFQEALQIVETAIAGKAYSMEREIEDGKPVIEVGINGQEVFVDAESSEVVGIEDLRETGDREDIQDITEALELQQYATITIQDALEAVESSVDGQVHTVELENEEGNLVYEVMIGLQEIYVDAGNGQVLYTETVGQVDNHDDAQPTSSIQVPLPEDSNEDDQEL